MPSDAEYFYFGHPAAGQDTYLDKYFIPTSAFKTISDPSDPRCIVVGKKGCGKTALFTKLAESRSKSRLITSINPDTHQLAATAVYSYRQYANLFQYEILLEVLKTFCEDETICDRFDEGFVLKAKTAAGEYVQIVKGLKRKLKGLKEFQILGCGLTTEEEKDTVLRLVSAQNSEKLKKLIMEIMAKGIEILVLVDDPDLLFGEAARPIDIIGGLLLASVAISSMKDKGKIKVCTLVKQHKYEQLSWQFEDFDKISQNALILSWEDKELDELLVERIRFREKLPSATASLTCWSKAFDVTNQADVDRFKKYLYPRLTNGPRDLITFCNMAMQAAKERRENVISAEILAGVEGEYSKDCLKEVGREFNGPYPGIVSVIVKLFDHPNLRKGDKLPREVMEVALSERYRAEDVQSEKRDKRWLAEAHGRLLVEILFKVGVIGFMSKRNPTVAVMSYSPGLIEDSFQNATEFFVHPAYRKSLGM